MPAFCFQGTGREEIMRQIVIGTLVLIAGLAFFISCGGGGGGGGSDAEQTGTVRIVGDSN